MDDDYLITLKIETNFKIEKVEIKKKGKPSFEEQLFTTKKKLDKFIYDVTGFELHGNEGAYILRIKGKNMSETYDCDPEKGCKVRIQKEIEL